jgi:DNA-binding SARP family transcriptional activator
VRWTSPGARAETLDTYTTARTILVDELGIEPGAELQQLHATLLAAEPFTAGDEVAASMRRASEFHAGFGRGLLDAAPAIFLNACT